jgi:hypothetical protein
MYNILVYHRPNHQQDPNSPICEVHTKKIKRQKIVGKKGVVDLEYIRQKRRFYVNGEDIIVSLTRNINANPNERIEPKDTDQDAPF